MDGLQVPGSMSHNMSVNEKPELKKSYSALKQNSMFEESSKAALFKKVQELEK